MIKTAFYSAHNFEQDYIKNTFNDGEYILVEEELNLHNTHLAQDCEAISLFTSDNASAEVIQKLASRGVRFMTLRSVGYDHVDLDKAREMGIRVANVPAYSPYAVAEHAVALLLALNRKIVLSQQLIRTHDFRLDQLIGFDLKGKTVGIVGFGKIGQTFARIMKGFGCKLIVYDPVEDKITAGTLGAEFVTFGEICLKSDIISIHCPLSARSKHLFDKHAFCLLKRNAILINTSRGKVINTDDLLDVLDEGTIGAVGLDVYEFEKGIFFKDLRNNPPADKKLEQLLGYPNVLITGHQAFLTSEALEQITSATAYNLRCFASGWLCENEISLKA